MSVYWIKYRGTRFPVRRGETILGRSPYCSIVVNNGLVSREHCALRLTQEGLQVVDLGSTNGTKVNNETIGGGRLLSAGDVIGVGTDLLEVIVIDPAKRRASDSTKRSRDDVDEQARPDEVDTLTYRGTLELVETLVASAAESQNPLAVEPTIRKALEELLASAESSGVPLGGAEATRIAALAENVASWPDDHALDEWRDRTISRARRLE